jgi:hypothetical protein
MSKLSVKSRRRHSLLTVSVALPKNPRAEKHIAV